MSSPFLSRPASEHVAHNELAFAIRDAYPVSPGHTLVVPRRLVATWFDARPDEQKAILDLVDEVKRGLDAELKPDGYNVGFNAGKAAGQTVFHLHVHVIPRFEGDVEDPRGGVRYVIPDKANYLVRRDEPLTTGVLGTSLLDAMRPLLPRAEQVAVVAAFVQDSGLQVLEPDVLDALRRGTAVRLVTGDYLNITQARALRRLLDWQAQTRAFLAAGDADPASLGDEEGLLHDSFEARIVETADLPGSRSFHPKSWRFEATDFGTAFVGSSNVSRSALRSGVEWNLRVDRARDPLAYGRVVEEFGALWQRARPLDEAWLAAYRERARSSGLPMPLGDADDEEAGERPSPRPVQEEALAALAAARSEGRRRSLTVLATGLGKTYLAAFDLLEWAAEHGRLPRVLFLAHRLELLRQAAATLRKLLPDATFGWFVGAAGELDADVVFASVQKLSRPATLHTIAPERFDYVVVDEVHHAPAASWRRVLDWLEPRFMLGLTATPERADEADVLGLFDDHVAFRMDLGAGIGEGLLAPFRYEGLRDVVDYKTIPWANRSFDPEALAAAVQTQARMETLWAAWQRLPGSRSLVFCASIAHADFVRDWLRDQGVRAAAVHTGPASDEREASLVGLQAGELEAVCAVDLFNEGVDVPLIDRVVMLRPTASPVVFLQQLGRGLRKAPGKEFLQVVDFVGNHKAFLSNVRMLLSLGARATSLRDFFGGATPELPPGCSVDVELEAKDLLRRLLPSGSRHELVRVYRELKASRDERPTAGELFRRGLNPASVRKGHGSWFGFVRDEGDLGPAPLAAFERAEPWLRELGRTQMTKCFKMVVLEVLLEADALGSGMALDELARRCHGHLARSPELFADLEAVRELPDPRNPDPADWARYWRKNPVAAWAGRRWFEIEGETLVSRVPGADDPAQAATLAELTRELVDWRLAQYRRRRQAATEGGPSSFVLKVRWNQRDPILFLPTGPARDALPRGEQDIRLPDGTPWVFRFVKVAINVAHPIGSRSNGLPDLLRGWFGPAAGRPGTDHEVRLFRTPDGWAIEPATAQILAFPQRDELPTFPTWRAAASMAAGQDVVPHDDDVSVVRLPAMQDADFAVRASGDSMDGGADPIRDGDWLLMRWARGRPLAAVEGRIGLIQRATEHDSYTFHVKRVRRTAAGFELASDNPAEPSIPADAGATPIALLAAKVAPESLAPRVGALIEEDDLAEHFAVSSPPGRGASRIDGHLFLLLDEPGQLTDYDATPLAPQERPGETAFVLARPALDRPWRYCGVGRWRNARWTFDEVDFETWRALGEGRGASRRLPGRFAAAADELAASLLAHHGEGADVEADDRRFRLLGGAQRGGLRIDGGESGFAARTISRNDLGWGLAAEEHAQQHGAVLDEALVNRLRYLDGTPRTSTRWIDTRWALRLLQIADTREA